jgi:hypothetical protein
MVVIGTLTLTPTSTEGQLALLDPKSSRLQVLQGLHTHIANKPCKVPRTTQPHIVQSATQTVQHKPNRLNPLAYCCCCSSQGTADCLSSGWW